MRRILYLATAALLVQVLSRHVNVLPPKYPKTITVHAETYRDALAPAAHVWNDAAGCTLVTPVQARKDASVLVRLNRGEIEREIARQVAAGKIPRESMWAGMYGPRTHLIHVQPEPDHCIQVETLAHEIGHALGFNHTETGVMTRAINPCNWWSVPTIDPVTTAAIRSRCDEISK